VQTELCIVMLQYGIRRGFSKPNSSLPVQCYCWLDAYRWSFHNYTANQVFNYSCMFFIGLEPYCFICNILEMDTIIFIKLFRSAFVNDHFVRFLVVQRKLRSFICELSFISIYYILFLTERSFSKNYRFLQFIQFFHNFVWKLVHFVHSFFSFNQIFKKWFIYSVTHP